MFTSSYYCYYYCFLVVLSHASHDMFGHYDGMMP